MRATKSSTLDVIASSPVDIGRFLRIIPPEALMALEQFRPVSNGVYYLSEPTLNTPRFEGNGAKLLGIQGEAITPASFLNLFDGYLLNGDEAIKLPDYIRHDRRGAFEMTANLPKC